MKKTLFITLILLVACTARTTFDPWVPYDESGELAANADNPSRKLRYKLIQSRVSDKNDLLATIESQIGNFSGDDYEALKPLILEQNIPSLQESVRTGKITYEKLTKWYLYRIAIFETNRELYLNSIISINPNAVKEAKARDKARSENDHPIFGMPVLFKDNVGMTGQPTTAGAHALLKNNAPDAFIIKQVRDHGGVILGKTNLSEWANYLSSACPNGYCAVGGQTLNPYGRKKFDTGGSSSGSGAAMAANFAAAAVGTETSGSILSPSSKHSLVGLKPSIGLLSRGGIVPLSGTLDTPGPMTRSVIDNAILLSAMTGEDPYDPATIDNPKGIEYWKELESASLKGVRVGVNSFFKRDSVFMLNVEKLASLGAEVVEFDPVEVDFNGFSTLLSGDMKVDLPAYLEKYASDNVTVRSVADVIEYNLLDTTVRMPYGQTIFDRMNSLEITPDSLNLLREKLISEGRRYFDEPMDEYDLDVVLSVDNRNAGFAAAALYPCLTIPMGYRVNGQPCNITFIAKRFEEGKLLKIGYAYEKATHYRMIPENYN